MFDPGAIILPLLLALILYILFQLAMRWFNCWYWKINHRLHALEDMSAALRSVNQSLQELNRATQDVRMLLLAHSGQAAADSAPSPHPAGTAVSTPAELEKKCTE